MGWARAAFNQRKNCALILINSCLKEQTAMPQKISEHGFK